jgi:predicted amidohydrolase
MADTTPDARSSFPSMPSMPSMRIAAAQMCVGQDPDTNLAQAAALVAEAAGAGARLVALPENVVFMGDTRVREAIAEPLDGPRAGALCALAAAHGVWLLVGGFPERGRLPARPYNTSFLIDPSGARVAAYRKLHLFDVDLPDGRQIRESSYTAAGDAVVTAEVDGVRVGLSICYDLRFPELFRAHVAEGARVLFVPSAFTVPTGQAHWHLLLRARAVENQCFVVAPAQTGVHGASGRSSYGHSLIVDPWGDVLAERADGVGLALADLDFTRQDDVRARLPVLAHRRPELTAR